MPAGTLLASAGEDREHVDAEEDDEGQAGDRRQQQVQDAARRSTPR